MRGNFFTLRNSVLSSIVALIWISTPQQGLALQCWKGDWLPPVVPTQPNPTLIAQDSWTGGQSYLLVLAHLYSTLRFGSPSGPVLDTHSTTDPANGAGSMTHLVVAVGSFDWYYLESESTWNYLVWTADGWDNIDIDDECGVLGTVAP